MAPRLLLIAVLVACLHGSGARRFEPKGASVTLHAKWLGTPLLHEAAEFLADEDPALFWRFVEGWSAEGAAEAGACWERLSSTASGFLTPTLTEMLRVSLATRQYSPRLEALRQLSAAGPQPPASACCWAVVNGRVGTDAAGVAAALAAAGKRKAAGSAELFPFDHLYRPAGAAAPLNASDPSTLTAVLYAPIGAPCAKELHTALAKAAEEHGNGAGSRAPLAYAWRLLLAEGCAGSAGDCAALGTAGRLVLPGYGVELAIKNMEYNARDDSAKDESGGNGNGGAGGEEGPGEVAGFLFPQLIQRKPHLRQELLTFRDHLLAAASQEQVLKVWDLKDLGLQACQRITSAADPLHLLQEVAQGFPTLVEALSRMAVAKELRKAVEGLQHSVPASAPFLLVNGQLYETKEFNLFAFVDTLRKEVRLWDTLRSGAQLPPESARAALLLRGTTSAQSEGPSRVDLQGDFIAWVNDLEEDARYASWPSSLDSLLMPMFPGRLPAIGRNVLNAVFAFNPASQAALNIGMAVMRMYSDGWPLRYGLLPVAPEAIDRLRGAKPPAEPSPADKFARLLGLLSSTFGGHAAAGFLSDLRRQVSPDLDDATPDFAAKLWAAAERLLPTKWAKWGAEAAGPKRRAAAKAVADLAPEQALAAAVGGSEGAGKAAREFLDRAADLAYARGIAGMAGSGGVLVFNGIIMQQEGAPDWRQPAVQGFQTQLQQLQEDVYLGRLSDDEDDVYAAILELHGAVPRYNPRVLPPGDRGPRYIRLSGESEAQEAPQLELTGPELGLEVLATLPLRYFSSSEGDGEDSNGGGGSKFPGITHWVLADVQSQAGAALVSAALQHHATASRVGLLLNVADPEQPLAPAEAVLLAAAAGLADAGTTALQGFAETLALSPTPPASLTQAEVDELLGQEGLPGLAGGLADLSDKLTAAAKRHSKLIRAGLGLAPGTNAVVSNGRVVTAGPGEELTAEDFDLMNLYAERSQFAGEVPALVASALAGRAEGGPSAADIAAVVSSVLAARQEEEADPRSARVAEAIEKFAGRPNFIATGGQRAEEGGSGSAGGPSPLLVQAVLNPLSKTAQQLAPVLLFLREQLGAEVRLALNPGRDLTDMPLKTFYKYALPGIPPQGPPEPAAAEFTGLPPHKTLTLGMDVPEPWLVEPTYAPYDLDNLRLEELGAVKAMEAEYELEALMLTGSCLDLASLQARIRDQIHPRGVQLQLGTESKPAVVDTLVMSNLGYFQLKAAPGVWNLALTPGRSRDLYNIVSSTGGAAGAAGPGQAASSASPSEVPVALTSFEGKHMYLFLRKHAERLNEDVLEAGNEGESLWSKLGSWGKGNGGKAAAQRENEAIHVFTVASGHMYERLQKIMILSVIKRTPARVKFWFIKNYMSPQMKAFVPHMAEKYNFDYEFVTYKWPSWLHKQSEKQRIIWAYKILFLDVLFPLGLRKVIFCDSDQVVRADLRELWNMDLQGAPYGYAPLCDGNADMDGFRFWKTGFWLNHLQGKPYHISALYVVDLERFRQIAAGDQLRVMYDNLSKDPNSLANLDQDLPNYAQHSVPIFSLPTEWLWCETWCGNATKPQARTIDLCNNPLTKEPKLNSARRIIKEWPDLNREAQEFTALVERVLAGEAAEEEMLASSNYFQTRLAPMVEGSVGSNQQQQQGGTDPGAQGASEGGSGECAAAGSESCSRAQHDASEL